MNDVSAVNNLKHLSKKLFFAFVFLRFLRLRQFLRFPVSFVPLCIVQLQIELLQIIAIKVAAVIIALKAFNLRRHSVIMSSKKKCERARTSLLDKCFHCNSLVLFYFSVALKSEDMIIE